MPLLRLPTRRNFLGAASAGTALALGASTGLAETLIGGNGVREPKASEHTSDSLQAIANGMKWLERAQVARGGYRSDAGQAEDIGCTALVGLAMLADGSTPIVGPNRLRLRAITNYLIKKIKVMPESNITSKTDTQLQGKIGLQAHSFFALLYLTQIAGESHLTEPTLESARKLCDAVTTAQLDNGSWGRTSWAPTLGTVMGWTSLRSAHFAGLDVGGSPEKTAKHLIESMEVQATQQNWMHQLYKNAAGIRVLYAMNKDDQPIVKSSFRDVLNLVKNDNTAFNQAGGEEYLAFHLITETMLQKGGEDWNTWFPEVRDKICGVQNADGSWTGHHCITSRTFCTAAACLVLSAPNRYLPISQ